METPRKDGFEDVYNGNYLVWNKTEKRLKRMKWTSETPGVKLKVFISMSSQSQKERSVQWQSKKWRGWTFPKFWWMV